MPIRNESDFIARSLGAVFGQTYSHTAMEVLLADGMSTDDTRSIIRRLALIHPEVAVAIVDNPGLIVPTGMNAALPLSRGDVIIRVDGHTVIAPDYVQECLAALERTGADNIGGCMTAVGHNDFGRAVALATSSPFGVGGARFHYSQREEWVDTVYMGAWRREVFETIGRFDEELVRNQDDEFNYRLLAAGGRILLSPRIKSTYYNRSTPRTLWEQYFRYGYWKVRVMQKHPKQMRPRQFIPPLFVVTLGLTLAMTPFSIVSRWVFGAVVLSYVATNLFASTRLAAGRDWRLSPLLSLAFVTVHLSYGVGFWFGLVRFWNRWGRSQSQMDQTSDGLLDVERI
jgi:GT2 family glycosyltransferase